MTAEQQRTETQAQAPAAAVGGLREYALALLVSMRPRQWSKNLIVFAALIFDDHLFEPSRLALVVGAFVCFCLASSTVYLVNDLLDRESDRLHPVKRNRPIASGRLPERLAVGSAIGLLLASTLGALALRPAFAAIIVLYLALLVTYSFSLKHIVILDVFTIAGGFVLRAAGGAVVLAVPISPWLYVCTVLLSLFLGFGKRRNELRLLEQVAGAHRRNLDDYTLPLLDQLIMISAAAIVMAYSLYTFVAPNLPGNHAMMLTIPIVLYGLFRYLYLMYARDEGGAPEQLLLTDRPLLATVGVWAAMVVAVLYGPL